VTTTWRDGTVGPVEIFQQGERALLFGDALFETMRVHRGEVLALGLHIERLHAGVRDAQLPAADLRARIEQGIGGALRDAEELQRGVMRVVVYPRLGELSVLVCLDPYEPPAASDYRRGVALQLSPMIHPGGIAGKTTSRSWAEVATRAARGAGFDGALLLDRQGHIVETPQATPIWHTGGLWYAPSEEVGGLQSTTLDALVERGLPVERADIELAGLRDVDALVLLSALRIAMGVRSLDDRVFERPDYWAKPLRSSLLC